MKRRVLSDAANVSTTNIVIAITQFLETIILARTLQASDLGVIALLAVILGFGRAVADLGTSFAIVHFRNTTRVIFSSLYWLVLLVGIALFAAGAAATGILGHLATGSSLAPFTGWLGLSLLFYSGGVLYYFLFQKELRYRRIAVAEIAARCSGTLLVIILALGTHRTFSFVAGQVCYSGVRSVLLIAAGVRLMPLAPVFSFASVKPYLQFGFFQMGERLVTFFSGNIDNMIIARFLGTRDLGYYKIAYDLITAPMRIINPVFGSLAIPRFARDQHDSAALRVSFLSVLRLLSLVSFPLLFGLCATGSVCIPALYGAGWSPVVPLLWLLLIMALTKVIGNVGGSLLVAKGRVKTGFFWNCAIAVGNTLAFLFAVRRGVQALALAYSLVSIVYFFVSFPSYLGSTIGLRLREYLGSFTRPALLAGCMAAAVLLAAGALYPRLPAFAALPIVIAIGAVVYPTLNFICAPGIWLEVARDVFRKEIGPALELLSSGSSRTQLPGPQGDK